MSSPKLTDAAAKAILLKWPRRSNSLWPAPSIGGFWLRAQPKDGSATGPRICSPGAKLFTTQPDGLWACFAKRQFCDLVVIEVCGSIQNLNDKRSRYIPSSHSLVLSCSAAWFNEHVPVQGGGKSPRCKALGSFGKAPASDINVPIRFMRILYAIPDKQYGSWCLNHTPTGQEFFCKHSSLSAYKGPQMQSFLRQMSILSQFYTAP